MRSGRRTPSGAADKDLLRAAGTVSKSGKDAVLLPMPRWTYRVVLSSGTTGGVGAVAQVIAITDGSPMPASHQFFPATTDEAYEQGLRALKRVNPGMRISGPG
jgi:hypothetical protein